MASMRDIAEAARHTAEAAQQAIFAATMIYQPAPKYLWPMSRRMARQDDVATLTGETVGPGLQPLSDDDRD